MFSETESIRQHLLEYPQGLTQTDLSRQLKINRVSISKYLATMVARGELECRSIGPAKLYTLTKRLPLQSILSQTEDHVIITDSTGRVTQVDERTAALFDLSPETMTGRMLGEGSSYHFFTIDGSRLSARQMNEPGSRELMLYSGERITHFNQKTLAVLLMDGTQGNAIILTDITEFKRVEAKLRNREQDFISLVQNASDMIVRFDTALHHIYCNPAVERQFGISLDQILGKTPMEVDSTDEQARFVETSLRRVLETGEEQEVEQPVPTPSGMRHFLTRIVPERDDNGGIVSLLAITRDITERKRAEEALRESEERLHLVLRGSNDAPWDWNLENNALYYSPRWWEMLGYHVDELPSDAGLWERFMHPEDRDRVRHLLDDSLRHGPDMYEAEFRLQHKAGHYVPVLSRGFILRDCHGTVVRVSGTNTDLTERKRMELELASAYERLKETNRLAHIGTWEWILETDTVTWSDELYTIAGFDPSLPAPTFKERFRFCTPVSWDRISGAIAETLNTGKPYNVELEFILPDGSARWANASGTVKRDESGKVIGLYGALLDITEYRRMEETLRDALREKEAILKRGQE